MKLATIAATFAVAVTSATSTAQTLPCSVENPIVNSPIRWGNPIHFPINGRPWYLPWGEQALAASRFDFGRSGQYGFINGRIAETGRVVVSAEVRNDVPLDGDHFAVLVVLRGWQMQPIAWGVAQGGLNASGVCRATGQGHSCWKFHQRAIDAQLSPEEVGQIAVIEVRPGQWDEVDDQTVRRDLEILAACYFAAR
jgi:hypothetical protein